MIRDKNTGQYSSIEANEYRKLSLSFGALILALMLIVTGAATYLYSVNQKNQEERLSKAVALLLSESVSRVTFSGKYHTQFFLEEMKKKIPLLETISVETWDGVIIAHSNPSLNDTKSDIKSRLQILEALNNSEPVIKESNYDGKKVNEIIIPYRGGIRSELQGVVRVRINTEEARRTEIFNYLKIIALISVLTGIAIWIVLILSRYFGSRTRDITIRMETILNSSPAYIYMKDFEGRYLFINRTLSEMLEITNEEIRGKKDTDLFPEEFSKLYVESDRRVLDNDIVLEEEDKTLLDDGIHFFHSIKSPIKDSSGKIYAVIGIANDITEKKNSEKSLREKEEQYRKLLDLAPDPFFHGDTKGNLINTNNAAIELTGYSKEELFKMNVKELFPENIIESAPLRYDLLKKGFIVKAEREIKTKSGRILIVEMNSKEMPDGTFQSFFRDITRRKQAEESLKETESIFTHFMEKSPIYIFFKDENLKILRLSRNYEDRLRRPLESLIGKKAEDLFPSDKAKVKTEDEKKVLRDGVVIEKDEEFSGRYFNTIIFPISIEGSPRHLAGYSIDITEKRRTETLLQNSQKLESLGILAGGIAHDFNNLLSGIFGYLQLIKLDILDKRIDKIEKNADRAMEVFGRTKALTQQLLTFARGGEPHKEIMDLSEFIKPNTEFILTGKNVNSVFEISSDLWRCTADKNQIGQVLDNIIINAVQAMPGGGTVIVKADNFISSKSTLPLPTGRYIRLGISDTGNGIPESSLSRIFDPFYTTKKSGNGLGLATSYSIITRHGGIIEAESQVGMGSKFTIYLPAAGAGEETQNIETDEKRPEFSGRVLIMDDEEFVRNTAQSMLLSRGIRADSASNGDEAADMYRAALTSEDPYQAVILDLTVKGGAGGIETLKMLKQINPDVQAIASSGYSADPVMADPGQYGFKGRLIKPYRVEELTDILSKTTENS